MRIALLDLYTNGHHLKYAAQLVKYLQGKGHEVMFITWEKDERVNEALISQYPDLTLAYLRKNGKMGLGSSLLVRQLRMIRILGRGFKIAEQWQADILHLLYASTFPPHYLLSFKPWRFKLFGTLGGMPAPVTASGRAKRNLTDDVFSGLHQFFFKQAIKKAFHGFFILNVYPQMVKKALFEQFGWMSRYQDRVLFLHDPIYEDFYSFVTQDAARERLKLPPGSPVLLFFGELTYGKGLDILLEAVKEIDKELCIVIAGHPSYFSEEDIDCYKKQLKSSQRVIARLGFVPEDDVPYYFMSADAVLMPYRRYYDTGSSGILMQACSARKPVICADVGTIGQVVKSSSLGIVVTPESPSSLAEGISNFLEGMDKIKEKVQISATRYMSKAKWERIADVMEHAYTSSTR